MTRDAAAVLAGLIRATDDDVFDLVGRKAAVGDDLGDDPGEHVVRAQPGERAGMAPEGAAPAGVHIGVEHGAAPFLREASGAVMRAGGLLSSAGRGFACTCS